MYKPDWIKVRLPHNMEVYQKTVKLLREKNLTTVCQEANCPNKHQCFNCGTATFLILGDVCTRNCSYCKVKPGNPQPVDKDEPKRVAQAVKEFALDYVVITCVTRDDLADGGADIFVRTVQETRKLNPECKLELLISDLKGNGKSLEKIVDIRPEVLNHNVEVAQSLFPKMRPQGNYRTSIELLKKVKELNPQVITKSGMMLGLGETKDEIIQTMRDLVEANCQIMTLGQYLQPSPQHTSVETFYRPEEFIELKEIGEALGFAQVESAPLVRSSYKAKECYEKVSAKL